MSRKEPSLRVLDHILHHFGCLFGKLMGRNGMIPLRCWWWIKGLPSVLYWQETQPVHEIHLWVSPCVLHLSFLGCYQILRMWDEPSLPDLIVIWASAAAISLIEWPSELRA